MKTLEEPAKVIRRVDQVAKKLPKVRRTIEDDQKYAVFPRRFKGAVYTVWIFICICMSLRVFLYAKKMKFLTKGGIHCISQVFPWHFHFMREHSLVELTEHDDSAANIIVHFNSMYNICTAAFIVHISVYRYNEWTPQRNSGEIP